MKIKILATLALGLGFLVGCRYGLPESTDHTSVPGTTREFDYTNRHGEVMHCVVWNEGYNAATVGCIPAQKPVKK